MNFINTQFIANGAVTNAKAAAIPANSIKGNNTGSSGAAMDLSISQVQSLLSIPSSGAPLSLLSGGTGGSYASANALFNGISPLTTNGDILIESGGVNARLAIGTTGQVLTVVSGLPAWSTATGFANPMTTLGDVIYENATPAAARLAGNITTTKMMLSQTGNGTHAAAPVWAALVSGDIPNNAANTTGTAANITASSNATLTTLSSLSLSYSQLTGTPTLFTNPMTTAGDIIYENATPAAARLAIGTTNQVLTVIGGLPSWQTPAAAGANTALSNLASTSINADLLPATTNASAFGSGTLQWNPAYILRTGTSFSPDLLWSGLLTGVAGVTGIGIAQVGLANFALAVNPLWVMSQADATANALATGSINISTGAKSAGTGATGTITIQTGVSAGGAAGNITLIAGSGSTNGKVQIQDGSQGTAGYLWTSTDTVGSGHWAASTGLTNPMTTAGDIIYENGTPAPARLAIGTTNQVLTVIGGLPSWQTSTAANTALSNLASTAVNANITPASTNSVSLGTAVTLQYLSANALRFYSGFSPDAVLMGLLTGAGGGLSVTGVGLAHIGFAEYGIAVDPLYVITGTNSTTSSAIATADVQIRTGANSGPASTGNTGQILLQTGTTIGGNTGSITLTVGGSSGAGNGGNVNLNAGGTAGAGTAGTITINAGTASGGGANGSVNIIAGGGNTAAVGGTINLNTQGTQIAGGINIAAGAGNSTTHGGDISMYAGSQSAAASTGGAIYLFAGDLSNTATSGVAGFVQIQGGNSSATSGTGSGGAVNIQGGNVTGTSSTAAGGAINITSGVNNGTTSTGASGAILISTPTPTNGTSGSITIQPGGAGTTNTGRILLSGPIQLLSTVTPSGTNGAQTINTSSGTVNIAAAGTSVVVTNNLVTTNSIVFAVLRTADTTATIKNVVPAAGSFTITLGAAATAAVSIGFMVINE